MIDNVMIFGKMWLRVTDVAAGSVPGPLVLLVEDEKIVAVMATSMLEQIGCRVIHCVTAKETYEVFRRRHAEIDLVMLDMILPDANGADIFAELRQVDPSVNCLLASGYPLDEELQKLMDDGVRGYIHKPYKFAALKETVQKLL